MIQACRSIEWATGAPSVDKTSDARRACGSRAPRPAPDPFAAFYALVALYALACSVGCIVGSCLLWNWTASLPLGLYGMIRGSSPRRGDLVAFPVPGPVRRLVHERGYLPGGSLLVKPIVAVAGDWVCTRGGVLVVNGDVLGGVLTADHGGRALPQDDFCGVLKGGQVYVASRIPFSFDSRTFGPVDVHNIQARVVPLWTY